MSNGEKQRVITPVQLQVLLHVSYSQDPYPQATPAVMGAYKYLLDAELIEQKVPEGAAAVHEVTDRGVAFVKRVLRTPLPVARTVTTWVFEEDGHE